MMPQLTPQQAQAAISDMQERIQAKTLECVSLRGFLECVPNAISRLFRFRDEEDQKPLRDAAHNFLTAKYNQAIVDLRTLELQLKMYQSVADRMDSRIAVPGFQKA